MPLPRLPPLFFYLLHLIFYAFPQERLRSFSIGLPGIAVNFEVI
jgi:hypothetical protein